MIDRFFGRTGRERRRTDEGERLGGYIYGTIVVLATLVAGARAYQNGVGHVGLLVVVTSVVFWLAHVYAHALADSIRNNERLSWDEVVGIGRRESSIVEAAAVPALMLFLGWIGLFSENTAIWLAFAAGLGVLVTEGLAFARTTRLGWLGTLAIVALNLGMGLLLVVLKLYVSHH